MTSSSQFRILQAVFPSASHSGTPTPQATPLLGTGSFDQALDAPSSPGGDGDTAAENIKWERSWHAATSFLAGWLEPRAFGEVDDDPKPRLRKYTSRFSIGFVHVQQAVAYLVEENSLGRRLRQGRKEDSLMEWYSQQICKHYNHYQLPRLREIIHEDQANLIFLQDFLNALWHAQSTYFLPFTQVVLPHLGKDSRFEDEKLRSRYHALIVASVLGTLLWDRLLNFLKDQLLIVLEPDERMREPEPEAESMEGVEVEAIEDARSLVKQALTRINRTGLCCAQAETVLAEAMEHVLTQHVATSCTRRWDAPSAFPEQLRTWVAGPFKAVVAETMGYLNYGSHHQGSPESDVAHADIVAWQQRALYELGMLRLRELFDVVVEWEIGSRGAIEDLKHYTTTTTARSHVVNHFSEILSYRLLQPGASTREILQIYMSIIRAFVALDPRGVLLDRVARPIRRYLRDREDTVKIIVEGLLADPEDPHASPNVLIELASELQDMDDLAAEDEDNDLDWDDMNWLPDPADAPPEYKKSKALDVIGMLMGLFETKDVFVKEFQKTLGERLLSTEIDFDREIRVLELLKGRFGEAALQGCEVMLKDIFDSRRTDLLVKKEKNLKRTQPEIHTKILSRFFWPELTHESFAVPPEVKALQERYAVGFEEHRHQRRLTWLPNLGQATVELQLEDRIITELVQTWQASVIYMFQGDSSSTSDPVSFTVSQLKERLEMDQELVINALTFWVSKLVLYEISSGTYAVLENLPTEDAIDSTTGEQEVSAEIVAAAASASAVASATAASAVRSEEELVAEKMEMFWQYIVGMLTNQGSMPVQQMVMMLNIVVAGGFSHSNEELRAFLARKVEEGKLELEGVRYKVLKGIL